MGYSEWWHVDFKNLVVYHDGKRTIYHVFSEDGKDYRVPKKQVAHPSDYSDGDKNGCISIKEEYAVRQGWI